MRLPRHWRLFALALLAILFLLWRLRPSVVEVDTVLVAVGPLRETIDQEGQTRVRDRYVVAAPVTGRLQRVLFRAGDAVERGETVAWLEPAPLDARTRREAVARVASAEDSKHAADAAVLAARAALDQAERGLARAESLAVQGHLAPAGREEAQLLATTRRRELEATTSRAETAAHDLETARGALLAASPTSGAPGARTVVRAPVSGRVLRLLEESERVLPAGTPILELGNPGHLEIVSDLLSTDAVKVRSGDTMLIEEWGGDRSLFARVRLVEPSAFTKISALGVEEQRVNVIADLVDAPGPLGDRFRVETRVVLWGSDRVLKVPLSALVRQGDAWAAFVVRGGRARSRPVTLGHRGAFEAEVTAGLREGEEVIAYPSDLIGDGTRVQGRRRAVDGVSQPPP
jgi:HlyD family secretion protein